MYFCISRLCTYTYLYISVMMKTISMLVLMPVRGFLIIASLTMLYYGSDFAGNYNQANRQNCICFVTTAFAFFFLFLTVVYFHPENVSCELTEITDYAPQLQYITKPSLSISAIKNIGALQIAPYTDDFVNFFPEVSDLELLDESSSNEKSSIEVVPDPSEVKDTRAREALTAVKMALKVKKKNNIEKARKLFTYAMSLSPNHHDVLLHYGEFLESNNDFINADHYYLKALIVGPEDSRALANRGRTLPLVTQLDLEELKCIDMKREELVRLNKKDPTLKRLKKEIYFQHIYNSVAIEGNTMTLAETRTVVETRLAVSGKSIMEHNEILGAEAALRFVNRTVANHNYDVSLLDILEIHRRVLGYVDPVTAGTFRKHQVFVGEHKPPPPSDVEQLMEELVKLLQSSAVTGMHPVHIAAYAHHKFVYIHPFSDGNGRTARLLMNVLFIKYGFPPIIIRKEDRSQYYKCLQIANEGDIRPFYRFIARATTTTLDSFLYVGKKLERKALEGKSYIRDVIPLGAT